MPIISAEIMKIRDQREGVIQVMFSRDEVITKCN